MLRRYSLTLTLTLTLPLAPTRCPVNAVNYGEGIEVLCIDGLLDDPEPLKKLEAMPQGAEKDAARAALPAFAPEECAGDAYKVSQADSWTADPNP